MKRLLVIAAVALLLSGCSSEEYAQQEARHWVVNEADSTVLSATCNPWDRDSDGYVSCNVRYKDNQGAEHRASLECPAYCIWLCNTMCKQPYGGAKLEFRVPCNTVLSLRSTIGGAGDFESLG